MRVRFNRGALQDIDEILSYIATHNSKAAADMLRRFEAAAKLAGHSPEIGMRTERQNLRKIAVGNYLMVYEVVAREVIIHYVRHGARLRPWDEKPD